MAHSDPKEFSRFSNFDIIRATHKIVADHEIFAHILVPKHLNMQSKLSKHHPIILRFHGGGFATASGLFPAWFAPWVLELASRHSAVIVSADHRLIPESSIDDVLEDVEDFWKWAHDQLPGFILKQTKGAVQVDTSRIMTCGESAGGYLSLQLGLNHPKEIKAVTAAYPMIDYKSPHFTDISEAPILGCPFIPASLIEDHVDRIRKGEVSSIISADDTLERLKFMFCLIQNGKYPEFFPPNRRDLDIFDKLDDGAMFPRGGVFILHGNEDEVVPTEGSIKLSDKLRDIDQELNFRLTIQQGNHGFDASAKIDDKWLAEGLKDLIAAWLA
ncbi:hypothetical protein G7Z17_g3703 [Cylindrodendrum hubeiense]|uniref:Alpha/beta hydrolase fold-3 domain-containing protein n=1 Tax=Cylindrodendrum hubeiense TaxID=595255 RepID=A0A9P5HE70_9HYPO|nr:hypothetical protein G7Z17_g3703 [Cylindrodendrum hubeiense]